MVLSSTRPAPLTRCTKQIPVAATEVDQQSLDFHFINLFLINKIIIFNCMLGFVFMNPKHIIKYMYMF